MSLLENYSVGLMSIRYDKYDNIYHISKYMYVEYLQYEVEVCFFSEKEEISISQIKLYNYIINNFNLMLQDVIQLFIENKILKNNGILSELFVVDLITIKELPFYWEMDFENKIDGFSRIIVEFNKEKIFDFSIEA